MIELWRLGAIGSMLVWGLRVCTGGVVDLLKHKQSHSDKSKPMEC